ncbi:MAG: hypothetical protein PHG66_01725 [Candidatus Colwellbacteria bacterium]|nr:hypothetical protein [Candidatus Colwellbacteria bacterium]
MVFYIDKLSVTGTMMDGETKILTTEVYEDYMSDEIDFWTGDIKNIMRLDFEYLHSEEENDVWSFIEKHSKYLINLQSISFAQPLGSCQTIDTFLMMIQSLCNVQIDHIETGIVVYSSHEKSDKPYLDRYFNIKTITSIY